MVKRKVVLMGKLGKLFGREHNLAVQSGSEAIRALSVNFPEFKKHMVDPKNGNQFYKVQIDKNYVKEDGEFFTPFSNEIRIIPVISGRSSGNQKIFLGAALIAVGVTLGVFSWEIGGPAWLTSGFITAGVGMILGGIAQLLTPIPKIPKFGNNGETNKQSYIFNGAVNTATQGVVPLVFGRMIVGSVVVSAGIDVTAYGSTGPGYIGTD